MSCRRYHIRLAQLWYDFGHGIDDFTHARHSEPCVSFADKVKGRHFDAKPLKRCLHFPVSVEVPVVVQAASKARDIEGAYERFEIGGAKPIRQ